MRATDLGFAAKAFTGGVFKHAASLPPLDSMKFLAGTHRFGTDRKVDHENERGGIASVRACAATTSATGRRSASAIFFADSRVNGLWPRSIAARVEVGIPAATPSSGCVMPASTRRSDMSASDRDTSTTADMGTPIARNTAASLSICGEAVPASHPRIALSLTRESRATSPALNPASRRTCDSEAGTNPRITPLLNRRRPTCRELLPRRQVLSSHSPGVTLCDSKTVSYSVDQSPQAGDIERRLKPR